MQRLSCVGVVDIYHHHLHVFHLSKKNNQYVALASVPFQCEELEIVHTRACSHTHRQAPTIAAVVLRCE